MCASPEWAIHMAPNSFQPPFWPTFLLPQDTPPRDINSRVRPTSSTGNINDTKNDWEDWDKDNSSDSSIIRRFRVVRV
jgi:hypothetical protein